MRFSDLIIETFSAFNANRVRTLLTLLGVVIGISAVIAMTALIGGVKQALIGEMGLSQARLVSINYYDREMTQADLNAMSHDLHDSFENLIPITRGSAEIASSKEKASGFITGVSPAYATALNMKLTQGRFFTQKEADSASLVVVLDEAGVRKLFGSPTAQVVGQSVRIGGSEYEIVGVEESTDTSAGDSANAYMPFATCAQRINGTTGFEQVYGIAYEEADVQRAADDARDWLIKHYQIPEDKQDDSLYIMTMKSVMDSLDSMMAAFQALMTVVASISLLVGGIGIMNMMLTNVTERIREIGLRKAVGARSRDITRQFLLESIFITLAGGVFGIVLGLLGAFGLAAIAGSAFGMEGMSITPIIGPDTVVLVAGICVFIGVVFGYYPARRAAKLDPVESLRYQ